MNDDSVVVYWDSSAVLSALLTDDHSGEAKSRSDKVGLHFLSTLAYAEVSAVIARLQRERLLTDTLAKSAFEVLDNGPWRLVYAWPERNIIRSLSSKWPLRGADLWHLATAKTLHLEFPELLLLSFDNRLNQAARGEALL